MAKHVSPVDIDRPVADVWRVVGDLSLIPQWRSTVKTVDPPASLEVGALFHATTRVMGKTWTWTLRITSLEPDRRLGYDVEEGVVDIAVTYDLEPIEGGCRFTMTGESRPGGFFSRAFDRLGYLSLRRELDGQVLALKALVEAA